MASVLVAGATGYLGRYVVAELHNRGHLIRAVARDRDRARRQGPWGSPSLDGLVDEWALGNVTDPRFTRDLAADVEHVVSALGVTRQKADPWQIDNLANLAILNSALKHAGSFTYINALGGDRCPARLTRAKSAFSQTLSVAEISSQIINPPAYFSDMMEVLAMARRGLVTVLRPTARINPIHGADLAAYVVDRMEEGRTGTWDVGGPDVLSWREACAPGLRRRREALTHPHRPGVGAAASTATDRTVQPAPGRHRPVHGLEHDARLRGPDNGHPPPRGLLRGPRS